MDEGRWNYFITLNKDCPFPRHKNIFNTSTLGSNRFQSCNRCTNNKRQCLPLWVCGVCQYIDHLLQFQFISHLRIRHISIYEYKRIRLADRIDSTLSLYYFLCVTLVAAKTCMIEIIMVCWWLENIEFFSFVDISQTISP